MLPLRGTVSKEYPLLCVTDHNKADPTFPTRVANFAISQQLAHQPTKSRYLGGGHSKTLGLLLLKEPLNHQHCSGSTDQTKDSEHRDMFLTGRAHWNSPKTLPHSMNHATHKTPQHCFFTNPTGQPLRAEQQSDIQLWRQKDAPSNMPQVPNREGWCKHHSNLLQFLQQLLSSR